MAKRSRKSKAPRQRSVALPKFKSAETQRFARPRHTWGASTGAKREIMREVNRNVHVPSDLTAARADARRFNKLKQYNERARFMYATNETFKQAAAKAWNDKGDPDTYHVPAHNIPLK